MATHETNARGLDNQGSTNTFPKEQGKYSLQIKIDWAFSNDPKTLPSGQYTLRVNGQTIHDGKGNRFSNGKIAIDRGLKSSTGAGELVIKLTDGTKYRAVVKLGGLPNIATPDGLAQRLTNLGFYAGTETGGKCNARMAWAIRAFKRVRMNNYTRNINEVENSRATEKFLKAVQTAYGVHPDDNITGELKLLKEITPGPYCGMFGNYVFRRGSFVTKGQTDDVDQGPGQTGIWEGESAVTKTDGKAEPIAGDYTIYLRAFDPNDKDPRFRGPFSNRINLPQPIQMTQFVLFELGYWLVCGEKADLTENNAWNQNRFIPDGWFGRYTQWAVREFQCYAKFDFAAKENVAGIEDQILPRVFMATGDKPARLTGNARYPDNEKVNGELTEETRKVLQVWADGALRYPVLVCASKAYNSI